MKKSTKENKSVYIMSLEGADLYDHMHKAKLFEEDYVGMIPYSIELIKLEKEMKVNKLKIKEDKKTGKRTTHAVINVKFKQKVKSGKEMIKLLNKKIEGLQDGDYKTKLVEFVEVIKSEQNLSKWNEVKSNDLRKDLYENGFTITKVDEETGEILSQDKYVVYKRSSSKSRTGQCLFILEQLHEEMINWSRMYLPFEKDMSVDLASLLAYESLVGSSLESVITINPKNILIVDDVESKFPQMCNVVRKNEETGFLDSYYEKTMVKNSLFDGESLLESTYFEEGISMQLLRGHMFKSASFSTNIQLFLEDNCPEGIEYDKWKIKNMFNQPMLAKDIHMICTPTSLKALKFSDVIGKPVDMWNHWKKLMKKDKFQMGVVKHEKKSKRGKDEEGNTLQQTSYQMFNSLPLSEETVSRLTVFEKEYVNKLKNDDDFFIEYIIKEANEINSNNMFADLYKINKDIVNTKVFRSFRVKEVHNYVKHIKKGKIRTSGDYAVLLGNGYEFLMHSISKFNGTSMSLHENEIYTNLFGEDGFDKEYVAFRNPHTSPNNVLIAKNVRDTNIEKYFNLSRNIVCVNSIDFAIQDTLSGCDYDSDSMVIFNDEDLIKAGKECFGKYPVCINDVENKKKPYFLNAKCHYEIDAELANSSKNIGRVVNLGQECLSNYWDQLSKGKSPKDLSELMKKVDVMTILSGICIDLAKKFYAINIKSEVENVAKSEWLSSLKPLFWTSVSQNENIKNRVTKFNCPMDFLNVEMDELEKASDHKDLSFLQLLRKHDISKGNRKQEQDIIDDVKKLTKKVNQINSSKLDKKERFTKEKGAIQFYSFSVAKKTVKPNTMYAILVHMVKSKDSSTTKMLKVLHETQREVFLDAFKNN
ncbi:hypothetical protein M3690_04160 [Priestia megaterium]|uniref:hypothetical protein n=1 Tax=Priestia megaterium TaxID=1404 RepID=UPI002041890E|nr:hypothetical protein [Priestia megaterium]MCM3792485.1 hypothetical protein [Priestia megaterium]